jgi:hypothetical protein
VALLVSTASTAKMERSVPRVHAAVKGRLAPLVSAGLKALQVLARLPSFLSQIYYSANGIRLQAFKESRDHKVLEAFPVYAAMTAKPVCLERWGLKVQEELLVRRALTAVRVRPVYSAPEAALALLA